MPSFLNKVFGYKKYDDKETARSPREPSSDALLDGKYEAIAPVYSPTLATFAEAQRTKDSDRDAGFSLFGPKVRGIFQKSPRKYPEDVPHLTLQLPGTTENRTLGVVFEADPDSQILLDDAVIAAKRLSPSEALTLIRACTQAITERGLETLGIMHPHWFSASPDVQRRLISLFIRSLTQSQTTTLPSTPTPTTLTFENELQFTRSPHDVAAVLRWGLRHLSLENSHFGKDGAEWGWYDAFFQAEHNASYPLKGFSELLLPQLPASHVELLTTTLSLISSLASHAEANSISGSKLSKFLGLWLLVAARAEEADDWNRFYARWERSGRVLEHLFLARLREESSVERLPTRLQELVKYYPFNKGSLATDDGLLTRPRFSTRQYDALFVRVETLLSRGAQPKQHPTQLLLEAFQLPIDNPSQNEHIALWNALKTSALEEATPSDSEGPQFTRIFVDETIHLLSSIPTDSNSLASSALLTSPITKTVSHERSSSLTRASERAASKMKANNGFTPVSPPVSPISPSSSAVGDWAQFTLSGFGDTPTTQPLSALLSPDDDIEITHPQISRKSSRHRGKSCTRRRRSEDHEPLDVPLSSQLALEASIVETKLASVHVARIDEAFIDFWSDAVIDPISASWPAFVVCGLKQVPSAEHPIQWLVVEQAYTRQESQPSRVPSPDGRRGRSPRPSFKSDISGFRINSVFSTARKRFSVFNKSATDLDLKKSGGKAPVAGELGEILAEEEPPLPSIPSALAGLHADENGTVRETITSTATADIPDHLRAGDISTAPIVDGPPTPPPKEESDPVQTTVEVPSIEPTPQSTGGHNDSSVMPRLSVRASEETISAERGFPRTLDVVNSKVDITAPLTSGAPHPQPTQDACEPKVASGPALAVERSVAEEVHIQAETTHQGDADECGGPPVELIAQATDCDGCFHTEATGVLSDVVQVDVADNGSREETGVVAMPLTPQAMALAATPAVPLVVTAAVNNEVPEPAAEEPHVAKPSLQKASANPTAALAVDPASYREIDHLTPLSSTEVIATETGAQLEPRSMTSMVEEEAQGITEHAEAPTPTPELVTLVEETPGHEASVDVCGPTGDARTSATQPEILGSAASQSLALNDAAPQPVAAELQAGSQAEAFLVHPVEALCAEVVDTTASTKTEPTADRVSTFLAGEAQPHVQDNVARTPEARLVEALPAPEAKSNVIVSTSRAGDAAPAGVEAQAAPTNFDHEDTTVETRDAETLTPLPEPVASVYETPGPAIPVDACKAASTVMPGFDETEAKIQDPVVEAAVEPKSSPLLAEEAQPSSAAELSTQLHDVQVTAGALSTSSNLEAATAALPTQEEVIAVKAEAQSTLDATTQDAEVHAHTLESAPVEDTPEVAADASDPTSSTSLELQAVEYKAPEPVAEEAQALVDAAPIASEPVAIAPIVPIDESVGTQDVQASIETDEPSSASTPQSVDEATSPAIAVVSATEEIVTLQVEASIDPRVAAPTVDTVDDPIVEDAKPASIAPEDGAPVEETQVILGTSKPETLSVEPEPAEVSAAAPVVEDAPAIAQAEECPPVGVGASEEVTANQPKIDKTSKVDQPEAAAVMQAEECPPVAAGVPEEVAASHPEISETSEADQLQTVADAAVVQVEESSPVAAGAPEEVAASHPEISETSKVDQPQTVTDVVDPVTCESSVSTHVPAGLGEETAPVEP